MLPEMASPEWYEMALQQLVSQCPSGQEAANKQALLDDHIFYVGLWIRQHLRRENVILNLYYT